MLNKRLQNRPLKVYWILLDNMVKMPRKIHKLTEKKYLDFDLIGIVSSENDYRLSWTLNNTYGLQLSKRQNLEVFHKRLDDKQEFSSFSITMKMA